MSSESKIHTTINNFVDRIISNKKFARTTSRGTTKSRQKQFHWTRFQKKHACMGQVINGEYVLCNDYIAYERHRLMCLGFELVLKNLKL